MAAHDLWCLEMPVRCPSQLQGSTELGAVPTDQTLPCNGRAQEIGKKDRIPMRSCKTSLASKANYPNPGGACIYAHREAAVKYKEIWNTLVNGKHLKVGCTARAPSPCLFLPFYAKK